MPPSFFEYLEYLLVGHFLRAQYSNFFSTPQSPSEFARLFSYDELATRRYLKALQHFGLLREESSKFYLNSVYLRSVDNDSLFSDYKSFQIQLDGSTSWPYEANSEKLRLFDKLASKFAPEHYWTLKYQILVMNQFFQDHIIEAALLSGRSQARGALGISREQIFENYESHPQLLETYAEGFAHGSLKNNIQLGRLMNFLGHADYLDVGGGNGSQALAVKSENPQLRSVTVLDLPEAAAILSESRSRWMSYFKQEVRWLADDFFSPSFGYKSLSKDKYDVVALSWILHDWNDDQCVEILKRAKTLLRSRGTILVIEKLKTESNVANAQDFVMLVMADGYERSRDDYEGIFRRAGLSLTKVITPPAGRGILVLETK